MKIDYSTNINFFKLTEIDNNSKTNTYIFELSKDAIACLTSIFKNFGVAASPAKNPISNSNCKGKFI